MGNSIVEILARQASSIPDKLCIADADYAYTYSEAWEAAKAAAAGLEILGVGKRECVVVKCMQNARFLIAKLACELYGCIFVPVERGASEERISDIIEDTGAKFFLTDDDAAAYSAETKHIDMIFAEGSAGGADRFSFPQGEDTAEILYTTGTTGKPKGVEMTNASNVALAENLAKSEAVDGEFVEIIPLPFSHSFSLRAAYHLIMVGGAAVIADGVASPQKIFDLIDKYKATVIALSPGAASIMLKLAGQKLRDYANRIKGVELGTAYLPESTKDRLLEILPKARMYFTYGSTESGKTCILEFSRYRNRPNCVGKPAVNSQMIVVDDNRRPIESSASQPGLLACAGPMNMKGYWRQPELTAAAMSADGCVYYSDIGYIDADGFVYVLGRADDVINYMGLKISPEEVEESAKKSPLVADCACVPFADKLAGDVPKLFVVPKDASQFSAEALLAFLRKTLDASKQPKIIETIDELPRTYNGKLSRKDLRNR